MNNVDFKTVSWLDQPEIRFAFLLLLLVCWQLMWRILANIRWLVSNSVFWSMFTTNHLISRDHKVNPILNEPLLIGIWTIFITFLLQPNIQIFKMGSNVFITFFKCTCWDLSIPLTGLSLHSSPNDLPMKHKNLVFSYLSEKQILYCKIL